MPGDYLIMATLPSPSQVAGNNYGTYEMLFHQIEEQGAVQAADAARFLKSSGLSDVVLSKIWDLSDPNAKGYLCKAGFFTALKLVALAQLGLEVNIANILKETPSPRLGFQGKQIMKECPSLSSSIVSSPVIDWAMTPAEKMKYELLFDSLQPVNGVLPGNKVKGLLIDSKLPVATLGKIWDLADMDKDGKLDQHEFTVAMHLVYKALEKYAIPNSLPPVLLPPEKRADLSPGFGDHVTVKSIPTWVVTSEEKDKFDTLFSISDIDNDGYVSGNEIKDVFLKSGVPQPVLANIWALCDIKQSGKLNSEQFALAMWLIQKKIKKGADPPQSLTPEMVPPSIRSLSSTLESTTAVVSNPELDIITKDIEDLSKEKHLLEVEILQKEAEIKIKSSEAKSLQGELDTLAATLKQLENQKGEAQKRLSDLKNQVDKLRKDAEEQEALVQSQEQELISKKQELENLKVEENKLNSQQNDLTQKLSVLGASLQESQLNISQVKTKILEIQEHQSQLKEALAVIDNSLSSGETAVSSRFLELKAEFRDSSSYRSVKETQGMRSFIRKSDVTNPVGMTTTESYSQNGFGDPFLPNKGDLPPFTQTSKIEFEKDPFSSFDTTSRNDPFDPFDGKKVQYAADGMFDDNQDPFGCEPFAIGAPALPPKNKQPPPRPAPPRPAALPTHTSSTTDSFADFSSFNSKFSNPQGSPLEFTEDPFKDYRYEDVFNIEDPFKDTDEATPHPTTQKNIDFFASPQNLSISNLNGKIKSSEHISEGVQSEDLILKPNFFDKTRKDSKVVKCDSLPNLLS